MANGELELSESFKLLSGLSAAHEALMHAAIAGTGVIVRRESGLFETLPPGTARFRIPDEDTKIRYLTVVSRDGVENYSHLASFEPRDARYALDSDAIRDASLVIVRYNNGMSQVIKNRFGEIDHDGPAGL